MQSGTRSDWIGRAVGMAVFVLGVALLLYVFYIAHRLFITPPAEALGLKFTGDPKKDPNVSLIGVQFGALIFRLAYLFLMSIAGSLIANKGVHLYFSAMQGSPVAAVSGGKPAVSPPA